MRNRPFKIGITGGIGAGKSIVCEAFKTLNIPVYQADERAKLLMSEDANLAKKIRLEFGNESFNPDGSVNRVHLSKAVFNDHGQLKKLNGMVHPAVETDFQQWSLRFPDKKYILKEAALLVETGSYKALDFLLTVAAPESVRIKRVLQRDSHRSLEDLRAIIARQLDQEEKARLAKFVIQNDEQSMLIPQILKIHEFFINYEQTG